MRLIGQQKHASEITRNLCYRSCTISMTSEFNVNNSRVKTENSVPRRAFIESPPARVLSNQIGMRAVFDIKFRCLFKYTVIVYNILLRLHLSVRT